jgi:hypothetical protein
MSLRRAALESRAPSRRTETKSPVAFAAAPRLGKPLDEDRLVRTLAADFHRQ